MTIHFAFIRHGDYNQLANVPSAYQPFPLNDTGINQARNCAVKLHALVNQYHLTIDPVIDCSPMLRGWQTAEVIREELSSLALLPSIEAKTLSFESLAERNVGSVANLTVSQIEEVIAADPRYQTPPKDWKSNSDYCLPFPGAESLLDAGKRVAAHIDRRLSEYNKCFEDPNNAASKHSESKHLTLSTQQPILKLIIVHGASLRHAAHCLGILSKAEIHKLSMYHCEPVVFTAPETKMGSWKQLAGDWKVRNSKLENID